MTRSRYFPSYASVRVPLVGDPPTLVSVSDLARDLIRLGRHAGCDALLVDVRSAQVDAMLARAKQLQRAESYSRSRLATPRRLHEEELAELATDADAASAGGSTVELVVAGSPRVAHRLVELLAEAPPKLAGAETSGPYVDPDDLRCHTPLNQRAMRPNLELCDWLTTATADVPRRLLNGDSPVLFAGSVFIGLCDRLRLPAARRRELAGFALEYQTDYLGWSGASPAATVARRAVQIRTVARTIPVAATHGLIGQNWLDQALQDEPWFYFPESLWMQIHWFYSVLGLTLSQEVALLEGLALWASDGRHETQEVPTT